MWRPLGDVAAMTHCGGTAVPDLLDLCREAPTTDGDRQRSSSSACAVGGCDWSTTPSSKSLSSSVDVDLKSSSADVADQQCGWGPVQPRCCQVFRSAKVVLFFLCCLATIQVMPHHLFIYYFCEIILYSKYRDIRRSIKTVVKNCIKMQKIKFNEISDI